MNNSRPHKNKLIHILKLGILFLFITLPAFAGQKVKLVILHTNDTHSQVEPSEKSSLKTANMGGYARRMGVIEKTRKEEKNILLLDAGDFWQGTPYFNFYNGRVETDAMNRMKYDAVTLGNHEFDNGLDTLAAILQKAQFSVISSNYDVSKTPLAAWVKPWIIIKKGELKIGIMALNVDPKSLIIENNYKGMTYENPFEKANEIATLLKKKKKCDVIICLSHLGADSISQEINDFEIARKSKYIDVIIGGHSHSMIANTIRKNAEQKPVIIAQTGKSGFFLGRIDLELEKK